MSISFGPISYRTLRFITDFGDQAVILPAFAVVGVVLLAQRRRFLAGAWVLAVAGVLGAMLVLKLGDQSCGWALPALASEDLMNPSGHTASAAALWGCGIGTLAAGRGWRTVAAASAAGLAVAVLIGITRVMIGAHTVPEAIAGGAVGGAGALAFSLLVCTAAATRRSAGSVPGPGWMALPLLAALGAMAITHGHHLEVEPDIHSLSIRTIRGLIPACQPPPGSNADSWIERRMPTRP